MSGHSEGESAARPTERPLSAALLGMGFTALMYQVVITRELIVSFVGNELIVGIILLTWMLIVAAGSAIGGRLAAGRASIGTLAWLQMLLAPLLAAGLALARLAGQQGDFPGEIASPLAAVVMTAAALAPPCLLLGAQFAVGCSILGRRNEQGASRVYVLEASGAVAAGVLFHFLVADHLNVVAAVLGLGALNAALACWLSAAAARRRLAVAAGVLCAICLGPALWPPASHAIDGRLLCLRWQRDLVAWTNTRYGMWSVSRQADQLTFSHDGLPIFTTGPQPQAEVVHLALAAHPRPSSVLMIGGGPPAIREALGHPIDRLDYVELDARGMEFIRRYLGTDLAEPLHGPRVNLRFTDGRALVKRTDVRYDVIVTNLPDPTTAVANRYYTAEFFAEAARALRPGGLLMTGLSSPRTTLTGERRLTVGGVWRALSASFPELAVLPVQEHLYLLASRRSLPDPAGIAARMAQRGVSPTFLTPFAIEAELNPLAVDMAAEAVREASGAPVNTDFRPVAYHLQMRLWVRQFAPRAGLDWLDPVAQGIAGRGALALIVAAAVAALLLGRVAGYGRGVVAGEIAVIGLLEMGVQLGVIFAFQTVAGYLYHQIGLLMTLNMLGLALGAWLARRLPDRHSGLLFVGVCALFTALCVAIPALMRAAAAAPSLATAILGGAALLASLFTGAAFPLGVSLSGGSESRAGAALYAADLVGGAAGAALVSILLVPLTGLDASARTLAAIGAAAFVASLPLLRSLNRISDRT